MNGHFKAIATLQPLEKTRVWFVQKPMDGFNYANMSSFGEIIYLLRFQDRPSLNPGNAVRVIRERLRDWNEEDYLCAYGGDPLSIGIAFQVMQEMYPNRPIRWLRWNRARDNDGRRELRSGYYEPIRYSLVAGQSLLEEANR